MSDEEFTDKDEVKLELPSEIKEKLTYTERV